MSMEMSKPDKPHGDPAHGRLLPEGLEKRLFAYTLAAGAGLAAGAQPAAAGVVYVPTSQVLSNGLLTIDLNADSVTDFNIVNSLSGGGYRNLWVNGAGQPNAVVGDLFGNAAALPAGTLIGPGAAFFNVQAQRAFMVSVSSAGMAFGEFAGVTNRYLGLKFDFAGATHYGWARFDVSTGSGPSVTATLTGYAYETQADTGISAGMAVPEPASLALLAAGAAALSAWRLRKRARR